MASGINLAGGDGARRMTYAELAQARAISLASARRLARRHHWPRQVGNDGVVGVIVPLGQGRIVPVPSIEKRTPDHWLDRVYMTAALFLSLGVWAILWGAVGWMASAVSW